MRLIEARQLQPLSCSTHWPDWTPSCLPVECFKTACLATPATPLALILLHQQHSSIRITQTQTPAACCRFHCYSKLQLKVSSAVIFTTTTNTNTSPAPPPRPTVSDVLLTRGPRSSDSSPSTHCLALHHRNHRAPTIHHAPLHPARRLGPRRCCQRPELLHLRPALHRHQPASASAPPVVVPRPDKLVPADLWRPSIPKHLRPGR